jgi:fucose 4-O-acetylase-like acetyltransferase
MLASAKTASPHALWVNALTQGGNHVPGADKKTPVIRSLRMAGISARKPYQAGQTLNRERERIIWQDTARGLGAMLVVLGHVERGLMMAGIGAPALWHPLDFAIYTFHMPLFMFLSGLNVQASLEAGRGRFLRSKLLTVLYPYAVWCWVIGLFGVIFSRFTNHPFLWDNLLRIGWAPITLMWFLYALFVFMMVVAVLGARRALWLAVVLFPFAEPFDHDSLPHQLLHFFLFFIAGVLVGAMPALRRWRVSWGMAALAAAIYVGAVAAALALGFANYNSWRMLPGAVAGAVLLLAIAQRVEGMAWLATLGRAAMAIYVMHVPVTACLRILFQRGLHVPPLITPYLLSGMLGGVLVPLGVMALMRRWGFLPWFGLALGPRGRAWVLGR